MKLTGENRQKLTTALSDACAGSLGELEAAVSYALNELLANIVKLPATVPEAARKVVEYAEGKDGKLLLLLERLPLSLKNAMLAAICTALKAELEASAGSLAAVLPGEKPYRACLVRGTTAFIDREDLRSALEELAEGGTRVVVINGGEKTGKSWSVELIRHVGAKRADFDVVYVDLKEDVGPGYTLQSLMSDIASQMRQDLSTLPASKPDDPQYAGHARNWFSQHLKNDGPVWWIVFDGVDQCKLDGSLLDFIQSMAKWAERKFTMLRLVIISHKNVLPEIEHRVLRETIGPITHAELRSFFARLREIRKRPPNPEEDDALALQLMADFPLHVEHRLPRLAKQLHLKLKSKSML
jgi:hypothetical protein